MTLPAPKRTETLTMPDGASIIVRQHGNADGPRLILSHGNGFASDLYYPFWSLLLDRFDLILYDVRNHGWNPVGDQRRHNVATFIRDSQNVLGSLGRLFGAKPTIGVFHSLSAVVAMLHQQQTGGFAALVLFDPPVGHLRQPDGHVFEVAGALAEMTRNRQTRFSSRDELTQSVSRAQAFQKISPEMRGLLAETTLRKVEDGYELCCPAEYEAQIFEYFFGWVDADFRGLGCPVKAVGSDPTTPFSFMPAFDLSALDEMNYDYIPESTHLLPLEYPHECASMLVEFLETHGLA